MIYLHVEYLLVWIFSSSKLPHVTTKNVALSYINSLHNYYSVLFSGFSTYMDAFK